MEMPRTRNLVGQQRDGVHDGEPVHSGSRVRFPLAVLNQPGGV
jgi:hypothetical protein